MEELQNTDNVFFSFEGTSLDQFNEQKTREWILNTIHTEGYQAGMIQVVFCDDEYVLEINRKYLNHNTYTDIITFNYNDEYEGIGGDIFISLPRVKENAQQFGIQFDEELHRVIIHGILHLLGYDDQDNTSTLEMRSKENYYLSLRT